MNLNSKQYTDNLFDAAKRIAEAENFFNLLYGNVHEKKFGYLWTKQDKATYPFTVSNSDERKAMAKQAIELADKGFDVYCGVNLMDEPAAKNKRVTAEHVTLQTATVTDIDVEGGNHISNDKKLYPPNFDVAKSFLPCPVSILVNSGFGGVHGYCLYSKPITITHENRAACETRNRKFIDATRSRAGVFSGAVDGVGDLPRVLRVPGTCNYKLGTSNAPLVKLVEVNDVRFTPDDMDERLNALTPKQETKQARKQEKDSTLVYQSSDSAEYDLWRATKMLDYIDPVQLNYDNWFAVVTACKTVGLNYAVVDAWSRRDTTVAPNGKPRYNETENLAKWNEPINPAYNIETLAGKARDCGYNEKDSWREWCELHPEFKGKVTRRPAPMSDDDSDEREDFIWTQDRIKSCPVNLRLPANYQFGKSNITLVVPPKKPTDAPKYICVACTPIVPTKKFREPVKGTIEYEFAILSDDEWRTVEIDGGALADTRELSKVLSRHGAEIKKNEYLREFLVGILSLNSAELPKLKSHNQTGWVTDDYNDFAFSNNNKAVVRRQGYDYEKIFKPKGDREEWKKKFGEVVAQGGTYAKIIIGFAAAAPLLRPLELHNLQLHVHGRKSIGKTPMQKFAVSIFGDTKVGALTHTFAATPKSRLETACAFRDLPLICEELETLSKREAEKIPQDVYNYFLGIGGQALNKDGTKRDPKIFSGARLTSGEHSLIQQFGNAGEFKRVLELRCANLLEEEFAADLYPFVERNRGLFAEQWIRYIIKHHELIRKHYQKALKGITSGQKGRGNENDRTQLSTLVISAVGYQHFKICIGLSNLATDADKINSELNADIDTVIANLPTAAEMDDTARAAEDLSSYVASHDKSFAHEKENGEEEIAWGLNCCGIKFANGEVAFHPTELRRILQDELGYVSANKLINEWHDKGKLIANSGRKDHVIQIGEKLRKTIHFKANVIETAKDSAELDYYEKLGVV